MQDTRSLWIYNIRITHQNLETQSFPPEAPKSDKHNLNTYISEQIYIKELDGHNKQYLLLERKLEANVQEQKIATMSCHQYSQHSIKVWSNTFTFTYSDS